MRARMTVQAETQTQASRFATFNFYLSITLIVCVQLKSIRYRIIAQVNVDSFNVSKKCLGLNMLVIGTPNWIRAWRGIASLKLDSNKIVREKSVESVCVQVIYNEKCPHTVFSEMHIYWVNGPQNMHFQNSQLTILIWTLNMTPATWKFFAYFGRRIQYFPKVSIISNFLPAYLEWNHP